MTRQNARNGWSMPVSDDLAHRRASGRRRYNARRQLQAAARRDDLIRLWAIANDRGGLGLFEWGVRADMARQLGVHRSTVTRDLTRIFADWQTRPCPTCTTMVEERQWRELEAKGKWRSA
jgi:hypothetical protein